MEKQTLDDCKVTRDQMVQKKEKLWNQTLWLDMSFILCVSNSSLLKQMKGCDFAVNTI